MSAPNCLSCAFRLLNVEKMVGAEYVGTTSPQVDVCTAYGQVLGGFSDPKTALTEEDGERIAAQCGAYREDSPEARSEVATALEAREGVPGSLGTTGPPLSLTLPLDVPAPEGQESGGTRDCGACAFFCGPDEIVEAGLPTVSKSGRGAGLCIARGTLQDVGPGARKRVARECKTFTPVDSGVDASDYRVELLTRAQYPPHLEPLLGDSIVGKGAALAAEAEELAAKAGVEREPTDSERELGVTRFRRFLSDDRSRWVDLPVFDPAIFSEEDRAKIPAAGSEGAPETYIDHANLGYRVAVAWSLGETPALNGPAGTGKTMLFHWLAHELGLPFERVSITASSSVDDLAGYMELHGSETEFVLGRIPKAWARPCVMVIDEPNAGPPEVWQFIRPITDSAKQLVIDANHGQTINRHPYSFLGMAMNPAWDWRNSGVSPLADADGSRLLHVAVGYPSKDQERDIILKHCERDGITVADEDLKALLEIAEALRSLAEEQTLQVSWGIRQQVQVARLLPFFDLGDAFRMAVTDSLEPQQADLILAQVNLATAGRR